jgi:hypothetical protein
VVPTPHGTAPAGAVGAPSGLELEPTGAVGAPSGLELKPGEPLEPDELPGPGEPDEVPEVGAPLEPDEMPDPDDPLEPEEMPVPDEPPEPVETPELDELPPALLVLSSPASLTTPPNVPPPHAAPKAKATETRKNARIPFLEPAFLGSISRFFLISAHAGLAGVGRRAH